MDPSEIVSDDLSWIELSQKVHWKCRILLRNGQAESEMF